MSPQPMSTNRQDGGKKSRVVKTQQYATFYLDQELFGINILQVQEILMQQTLTAVPLAPDYVLGLISLRGQIVTAIDLKRRLGMETQEGSTPKQIVVKGTLGIASLQVDRIGEVMSIADNQLEPAPEVMKGLDIRLIEGVCPLQHEILTVLNVETLLESDQR